MIGNLVYYSLCNFIALIAIAVLAESIVAFGALGSAIFATSALYYKLKKSAEEPSKKEFIALVVICSAVSAFMLSGVVYFIYPSKDHSVVAISSIAFVIYTIIVFVMLRMIYIDEDNDLEEDRIKRSPVLQVMLKFISRLNCSDIKSYSDEKLIAMSARMSPALCASTVPAIPVIA